jgi:hypothetical protein
LSSYFDILQKRAIFVIVKIKNKYYMKRFLSLFVAVMAVASLSCELQAQDLRWGATGGVNFVWTHMYKTTSSDCYLGFQLGAKAEYDMAQYITDGFYLDPHNGEKYRLHFHLFGLDYSPTVMFSTESDYDEFYINDVDKTIKYIVDIGMIDKFVEHLLDNVIPAFLDYKSVSTTELMFDCKEK